VEAYAQGLQLESASDKEKAFMSKKIKQLRMDQRQNDKENPMVKSALAEQKERRTALANAEADFKKWKSLADKTGDAEASSNVGTAYATGYGVEKNIESAKQYWRDAAKAGHVDAQHNYGSHIELGQGKEWLMLAAAQGNLASYLQLADIYHTENNPEDELVWLVKAADEHNSMEAQTRAAVCCFNQGNMALAATYFCAASEQMDRADPNYATIQHTLGDLYHNGTGVARDADKAVAYYRAALAAGHDPHSTLLAIHYAYCLAGPGRAAEAARALAEVDRKAPLKTGEQFFAVGSAHMAQADLSSPGSAERLGHVRTAELRWKHALNRGYTAAALNLAQSAAAAHGGAHGGAHGSSSSSSLALCNHFLRLYVDTELRNRGQVLSVFFFFFNCARQCSTLTKACACACAHTCTQTCTCTFACTQTCNSTSTCTETCT
jgi:TPR repeat protein